MNIHNFLHRSLNWHNNEYILQASGERLATTTVCESCKRTFNTPMWTSSDTFSFTASHRCCNQPHFYFTSLVNVVIVILDKLSSQIIYENSMVSIIAFVLCLTTVIAKCVLYICVKYTAYWHLAGVCQIGSKIEFLLFRIIVLIQFLIAAGVILSILYSISANSCQYIILSINKNFCIGINCSSLQNVVYSLL